MLVDEVIITVKAGDGGDGGLFFKRNAQTAKGGPDGGNGGKGGDIYFQGINDITALNLFTYKKSLKAEKGVAGGRKNLYGRNGKDLIVKIPIGTRITNLITKESFEIEDETTKVLIARGGKGGRGNKEFRTATNQIPRYFEKGQAGEEKKLKLELRLIADVGLIGLPNAGKSSLLAILTHAHPKIGEYPFTTLEPNLGVMDHIVLADIPGLIEGASKGKGLGIKFLKHVEKTKVLVHCIDSTEENPVKAYNTIRNELGLYNKTLLELPEIILLTKADLTNNKDLKKKITSLRHPEPVSGSPKKEILPISIYDSGSLEQFKKLVSQKI